MKLIYALFTGLVFGVGISISGMINPAKVFNFFDIAGKWDPSLAFVMGGAVIVTFIGYRLVWHRDAPIFGGGFQLPSNRTIDARLVCGSALFGIGWGIAGFCPGAAIPALGTGRWEVVLFLAAVTVGFFLRRLLAPAQPHAKVASS
ncbi:YeeE/YedE family protein [Alphaproteobacteria bacterium KMM 3653]|uniref:YeeE/YedE family protein n=1 Tax=Harenicola maris TaxID=2841044 RepID=A0AAP2CR78_9RHOB|nr:YeeE/YedE family protein [Harenicola maris]